MREEDREGAAKQSNSQVSTKKNTRKNLFCTLVLYYAKNLLVLVRLFRCCRQDSGNPSPNLLQHGTPCCCQICFFFFFCNFSSLRLLLSAMHRSGCPLPPSSAWRHIVCEECANQVEGGYDTANNQVFKCTFIGKTYYLFF